MKIQKIRQMLRFRKLDPVAAGTLATKNVYGMKFKHGSNNQVTAFFLLPVVMSVMLGCGKGTTLPAGPGAFNFSVSGDLYMGDTLRFQSTAGDNSVFLWTFGDGHSSSQPAPYHVYYKLPHDQNDNIISDTVTLVVNNDIYHTVMKPLLIKPPVPALNKSWSWTGGYFKKHGTCCPSLSDHPLADTNFAITAVDDYTIRVWGVRLPFLADSNYFSNTKSATYLNATYIIYTPDTLYFQQNSGDTSGGFQVTYWHVF
jgi:hypothetical protein